MQERPKTEAVKRVQNCNEYFSKRIENCYNNNTQQFIL